MLWILNVGLLFIMRMDVYMCWALISQKHRSALIHKWLISWHGVERYASQPHCQIWCWPSAHENPPSTGAQAACPMCQVSSVKCKVSRGRALSFHYTSRVMMECAIMIDVSVDVRHSSWRLLLIILFAVRELLRWDDACFNFFSTYVCMFRVPFRFSALAPVVWYDVI